MDNSTILDPLMKCPTLSASGFILTGNDFEKLVYASSGIITGTKEKEIDVSASILL